MRRARTVLAALVLCAMAFWAVGVQGASAAGTTAYTCVKGTGSPEYKDSHCKEEGAGGGFITKAIEGSAEFEGETVARSKAEEEEGVAKTELIATVAGIKLNMTCGKAVTTGKLTNTLDGGVMATHFTEDRTHFTKCHAVLVNSPAKTCVVSEPGAPEKGTWTTKKRTITIKPEEMKLPVVPEEAGESFLEFELLQAGGTECPKTLNEVKVKVTGSLVGEYSEGSTPHVTFSGTQSELLVNGASNPEFNATFKTYKMGEKETTLALKTS